tara:strand:+ start:3683 stop:5731 length:2049 start_codon:yes stop_codon:yes gene_type:complete
MSQKKVQLLNPLGGNINVSGVITASSFVGSGEGLTGVASTDNIQTATEATFLSGVKITGVTTASGGVVGNLTGNVTGNATGLSGTPNITVGSVAASSGTFSGNVSIGGTLTYQDVTNIDSVGIITAQQGIQVLANGLDVTGFSTFKTGVVVTGVATATSFSGNVTGNLTGDVNAPTFDTGVGGVVVTGVVTATSFSGDGSNLTGIQAGVADFVASGTIPNGSTVVINSDGTVGIVTQTGSSDPDVGTPVVFENGGSASYIASVYDSTNQKVVIAYRDGGNSSYGTAIVGTVSGTTISFGTAVVFETSAVAYIASTYDSTNGRVVIGYKDQGNNGYGTAVVGTVSGTSISFGTPVIFASAATEYISAAYDSSNEKVVFAYTDDANSYKGTAIVGTVSGTSISFGTEVVFEPGSTSYTAATFDSTNNKVVIAYRDGGNSSYGTAIVGTVSGTSISFGSAEVFESANSTYVKAVFDSTNDKVVIVYRDGGNSYYGTAIVGTVSGTSISFGTAVVFASVNAVQISAAYDTSNQKVLISYRDATNLDYGKGIVGTVSGTSISFGTAETFETANTNYTSAAYDSNSNKVVIAYQDGGNSSYGTAVVFGTTSLVTNLTTENYIGIAAADISSGATGAINIIGGVNTGQTGLTTGRTHYVQAAGGIGLTVSSPSVVAGTSISDTRIIVKG